MSLGMRYADGPARSGAVRAHEARLPNCREQFRLL